MKTYIDRKMRDTIRECPICTDASGNHRLAEMGYVGTYEMNGETNDLYKCVERCQLKIGLQQHGKFFCPTFAFKRE